MIYYEWFNSHKRSKAFLILMRITEPHAPDTNMFYVNKIYYTSPDWHIKENSHMYVFPDRAYDSLKRVKKIIVTDIFERPPAYPIELESY